VKNVVDVFRQVLPLCVMKLAKIELSDVFRTKWHRSLSKIVQIASSVSQTWADKCSGPSF